MTGVTRTTGGGSYLLSAAAFIIVVAGMREAQGLLVPFLLSIFIAIIAAPALSFLTSHRIPTAISMILVIAAIVGGGMYLLITVYSVFLGKRIVVVRVKRLVQFPGGGIAAEVVRERVARVAQLRQLAAPFGDELVLVRLVLVVSQ